MKTLDEVITALDACQRSACEKCPYYDPNVDICDDVAQADALHYLKEYRETKKHLACLDDAEIRGDNTQVVNNPPLDWETLKSMEGKPVWVEDGLENGEWYIIECFTESGRFIAHDRYADDTVFKAIDMGNIWQAYRKKRS